MLGLIGMIIKCANKVSQIREMDTTRFKIP